MKHAIEKVIDSDTIKATVAWVVLGACLMSFIMYSYFVGQSIFRAFEGKQFSYESSEVLSRLNTLEEQYLSLQNSATLATAYSLGLKEASGQHYISRGSLGQALSFRDEI